MDFRDAQLEDLSRVGKFTDFWLSGRGKRVKAVGAVDDCFISPAQHRKYILRYHTLLGFDGSELIAWAVVETSGTLIHLLVAGDRRGEGIGSAIVKMLKPKTIRSKLDQSSGNPQLFYEKLGYRKVGCVRSRSRLDIDKVRPSRAENIDIFVNGGS